MLGQEVKTTFCGYHTKNKVRTRVPEIRGTAVPYLDFACERNKLWFSVSHYYLGLLYKLKQNQIHTDTIKWNVITNGGHCPYPHKTVSSHLQHMLNSNIFNPKENVCWLLNPNQYFERHLYSYQRHYLKQHRLLSRLEYNMTYW